MDNNLVNVSNNHMYNENNLQLLSTSFKFGYVHNFLCHSKRKWLKIKIKCNLYSYCVITNNITFLRYIRINSNDDIINEILSQTVTLPDGDEISPIYFTFNREVMNELILLGFDFTNINAARICYYNVNQCNNIIDLLLDKNVDFYSTYKNISMLNYTLINDCDGFFYKNGYNHDENFDNISKMIKLSDIEFVDSHGYNTLDTLLVCDSYYSIKHIINILEGECNFLNYGKNSFIHGSKYCNISEYSKKFKGMKPLSKLTYIIFYYLVIKCDEFKLIDTSIYNESLHENNHNFVVNKELCFNYSKNRYKINIFSNLYAKCTDEDNFSILCKKYFYKRRYFVNDIKYLYSTFVLLGILKDYHIKILYLYTVCLTDNYFKMKNKNGAVTKYLNIVSKLPMEMQMKISNNVYNVNSDYINNDNFNVILKHILKKDSLFKKIANFFNI